MNLGAFGDILKSEKGVLSLGGLVASTVLVAIGKMDVGMWKEMTLYILGIYTVGKTAQGIAGQVVVARKAKK